MFRQIFVDEHVWAGFAIFKTNLPLKKVAREQYVTNFTIISRGRGVDVAAAVSGLQSMSAF